MSFSFSRPELNGSVAPYFPMPVFVLDALLKDENLTESAKMMYLKLYSFVAFNEAKKGIQKLFISVSYLVNLTGYSSRTIKRNLKELREHKYLQGDSISVEPLLQATEAFQSRSNEMPMMPKDNDQDNAINAGTKSSENQTQCDKTPQFDETVIDDNVEQKANDCLSMLGIKKTIKIKEDKNDTETSNLTRNDEADLSQQVTKKSKNTDKTVPNVAPITNPSLNKRKITNPSQDKVQPTLTKKKLTGITSYNEHSSTLKQNETNYIRTALNRMKVKPVKQLELIAEIGYSITYGTLNKLPRMKAIRAALKLIESNKWLHPHGMYQLIREEQHHVLV